LNTKPTVPARPLPPQYTLRATIALLAVLAAAFLLRLHAASGTFFNPDECVHILVANQTSLRAVYHASLNEAHPPLLFFLLYFWRALGLSESILRLPSVIAGTIFCWALFLWLRELLDDLTAWAGLIFAAFLPPMIELSAEVRQYALLVCFVTLSLYFLESALSRHSSKRMLGCIFFLYLAMLTHFSAILFAGALGLYSLWRLIWKAFSAGFRIVWAAGMAGGLALFLFFYRTHISQLHGSAVAGRMEQLLSRSYFHWGHDHVLLFIFARTFGVCQWVFGHLAVGDVMGLAFFAGVILLLRDKPQPASNPAPRALGILLLLPFAINCVAALLNLYPYGGTRHSAFLAPFVLAGVSVALVRLARGNFVRVAAIAFVTVLACHLFGAPHRPYMLRKDQNAENMHRAIAALRSQVAPADPIFVDFQTYFMIRYYLCPQVATAWNSSVPGFRSFECGGHRVISTQPGLNIFSADSFLPSWQQMTRAFQLKPGQTVWVFQAGWDIPLATQLKSDPKFSAGNFELFGKNISLFSLPAADPPRNGLPNRPQ
jgi:hypothetical protein